MYGSEQYGTSSYGENISEQQEVINSYKPNLLSYILPLLRNVKEFEAWNDTCSQELGVLKYITDDILKQLFVDTATWGLSFWEQQYGIQVDINKSYEDRRELIKAKMRGSGTATIQMIKNMAESFSNGECDVIEHFDTYSFTVKFIGVKGIPHNMQAFKNMLEIIKPAHLAYDFQYNCTVWNFLTQKNLTWEQAQNQYTWDSIKSYE